MPKKGCMASFSKFQPKALRIFLSCTYCRCKIFSGYPTIFPYSKAWNNPPKNSPVTYVQLSFFFIRTFRNSNKKDSPKTRWIQNHVFFSPWSPCKKWSNLTRYYFSNGLVKNHQLEKPWEFLEDFFRVFSSEPFRDCPGASIWAALDATNGAGRGLKKWATSFGKGHENLDFLGTFWGRWFWWMCCFFWRFFLSECW